MITDDVPTINMTNTKQEMLTAYQDMKKHLERLSRDLLDAEKQREKFRHEAARATAEKAASDDPLHQIHELKATVGRELTALAEKLEAETQAYVRLKEAVGAKEDEIKRIYGVETAASDLAALIEAHRQKRDQFEAEVLAARSTWESERQTAERQLRAEHQALERQLQTERQALERQRAWEKEEYDYAIAREHEQRRNKLEDEMAALAREIAAKREEAERLLADKREAFEQQAADREDDLRRRDDLVAQRERRVDELEGRVAAFPAEMASEVARAVKDVKDRMTAESSAREAILSKQLEGEKNVLLSRVDALQQLVDRQAKQIEVLSDQQQKAYEQVQDIAIKAIDGARRSIVTMATPGGSHAEGATG